jgi:hypothetical protein
VEPQQAVGRKTHSAHHGALNRVLSVESAALTTSYRYRVRFEDGPDVTTNYVGEVLQVGDEITLDGQQWVITDAKVLTERDLDFEIRVRHAEEE